MLIRNNYIIYYLYIFYSKIAFKNIPIAKLYKNTNKNVPATNEPGDEFGEGNRREEADRPHKHGLVAAGGEVSAGVLRLPAAEESGRQQVLRQVRNVAVPGQGAHQAEVHGPGFEGAPGADPEGNGREQRLQEAN